MRTAGRGRATRERRRRQRGDESAHERVDHRARPQVDYGPPATGPGSRRSSPGPQASSAWNPVNQPVPG